jgi:predicted AAA+ superfamily ATPase
MKKDTFRRLILDFQEKDLSHVIERDIQIPLNLDNKAISLVGVRRSGKTFILYSIINTLRSEGHIDNKNIVYINFEDDRLFPLSLEDLNLLLETYYELFPDKKKEKIYLFLDEIQNVPGWESFVRRVMDSENCRIFITGSSAKLLSKEISTALRGRTLSYEVFPLSFKEYIRFKGIEKDNFSSSGVAKIKNAFNEFIRRGGFPEVVPYPEDIYMRTMKEYLDLLMYRDIIDRYGIKNRLLLKVLMKFCFIHISKLFSVNKIFKDFKSQGLKLSRNTIYEYLSYIEDAYGAFSMPIHGQSIAEEMQNPKKIYSVDTGFKRVMDYSFNKDFSYIFENIVFLELRRETTKLSYFKKKQEVDFCFLKDGNPQLINVSYDISAPSTRNREINGLIEGMEFFSINESLLITAESEENVSIQGKTINIIPLWKWLLYR